MTTETWMSIATLENEHGGHCHWLSTRTRSKRSAAIYGAYIGAEISEELAPYISGRINDNHTESKRYELFRLPEADGKKTVRFRIGQERHL